MSARTPVVLVIAALAFACGGGTQNRIASLQDENRRLRADLDSADTAARSSTAYAQSLSSGGDTLELALNAADLDALSLKVLPYRIPARNFNSMVSGEVVVDRITNVRFFAANKLTCQVYMHGEGLRVTQSIPAAYKNEVARFLDGVTAGVITDLDVTLTANGNMVLARAVARRSALRKNRNASHEAQLTDGMNQSALRKAVDFDTTLEGTNLRLRGLTTTPTHVVVLYGP